MGMKQKRRKKERARYLMRQSKKSPGHNDIVYDHYSIKHPDFAKMGLFTARVFFGLVPSKSYEGWTVRMREEKGSPVFFVEVPEDYTFPYPRDRMTIYGLTCSNEQWLSWLKLAAEETIYTP